MIRISNTGYVLDNNQKIKLTSENVSQYNGSQKYLSIKKENGKEFNLTYEKLAQDICAEFGFSNYIFTGDVAINSLKNRSFIIYNNKREIFQPDFAIRIYKNMTENFLANREISIVSQKLGIISLKMGANHLLNFSDALILSDDYLSERPIINNKDLQRFFTYLIYNN